LPRPERASPREHDRQSMNMQALGDIGPRQEMSVSDFAQHVAIRGDAPRLRLAASSASRRLGKHVSAGRRQGLIGRFRRGHGRPTGLHDKVPLFV
jgi:hypothetical protein